MLAVHVYLCILLQTLFIHNVVAFWRMGCSNPLSFERLDPIVSPGGVASHVHNIAGGSNFGPSADYAAMQQSSCTSCPIKEDLSAYWTPQLYYHYGNGSVVSVNNGGTTVYYLQRSGQGDGPIKAFPEGFKMISGNPNLRSYDGTSRAQQAINYVCLDFTKGSYSSSSLPTTNCPDGLRAQIIFPSCWDGVNLDSPDHKSHVAFPTGISTGRCDDPKFPVRLVTIFYEVFYNVGDFANMWYGSKSPFVLANGDTTGYSLHGDFLNGWNVPVLQKAIDTCTDNSGSMELCKAFTLNYPASNQMQCHKSPSINEPTVGVVLDKLPGCNPIWDGTGTKPTCDSQVTPQIWLNTTGYLGNVVPDGYNSLSGKAIVKSYKGWNYQGCYQDIDSRVFPKRYTPGALTVGMCLDLCSTNGYSVGGIEYGSECWCGKSLNATKIDFQSCSMTCAGNSSQYCGGGMALTTYTMDTGLVSTNSGSSVASTPAVSKGTSAGSSSVGPSILSSASGYNYIGCYADSGGSRTLGTRFSSGDGSIESCLNACGAQNYKYIGLEYANECWCGDANISATKALDTDCNMACKNNSTEFCGGSSRVQVYQRSIAPINYNFQWSSVGCYTDSNTRNLRNRVADASSVEVCQAACANRGWKVAGLENRGECYCDDDIQGTGSPAASSTCNLPCSGNPAQVCGGAWRLSVYSGKSQASAPLLNAAAQRSAVATPASGASSSSTTSFSKSQTLSTLSLSSVSTMKTSTTSPAIVSSTKTTSSSITTTSTLSTLKSSSTKTVSTSALTSLYTSSAALSSSKSSSSSSSATVSSSKSSSSLSSVSSTSTTLLSSTSKPFSSSSSGSSSSSSSSTSKVSAPTNTP